MTSHHSITRRRHFQLPAQASGAGNWPGCKAPASFPSRARRVIRASSLYPDVFHVLFIGTPAPAAPYSAGAFCRFLVAWAIDVWESVDLSALSAAHASRARLSGEVKALVPTSTWYLLSTKLPRSTF